MITNLRIISLLPPFHSFPSTGVNQPINYCLAIHKWALTITHRYIFIIQINFTDLCTHLNCIRFLMPRLVELLCLVEMFTWNATCREYATSHVMEIIISTANLSIYHAKYCNHAWKNEVIIEWYRSYPLHFDANLKIKFVVNLELQNQPSKQN